MNETQATRKIRKWFDDQGGVCHKNVGGPMSSGFPDLTCCLNGHMWLIEVKGPGTGARESRAIRDKYEGDMRMWLDQGATLRQALALKQWQEAGATALIATCVYDLEEKQKEGTI